MSSGDESKNTFSELQFALGQLITRLRKKRAYSLGELAAEAGLETEYLDQIEYGQVDPTLGEVDRIAKAVSQTLGSLIVQAEEISVGKVLPVANPEFTNRNVPLPTGLTHDQIEMAINRTMVILNELVSVGKEASGG